MNDPNGFLKRNWAGVRRAASEHGYKIRIVPIEDVDELAVSYDEFYHWPEYGDPGEHVLFIGKPTKQKEE